MDSIAYSLFATPIGGCALAWGDRGILAVQLPEANETATRSRILRRHRASLDRAPPSDILETIEAIVALLGGAQRDLQGAPLDMEGVSPFDQRVYAAARAIPAGVTTTYGELAARVGEPGAARAVGRAMAANPFPIIVPCHRVLAADGGMGGFSAAGGIIAKARLLSIEQADLGHGPMLFDDLPFSVRPSPKTAKTRPTHDT